MARAACASCLPLQLADAALDGNAHAFVQPLGLQRLAQLRQIGAGAKPGGPGRHPRCRAASHDEDDLIERLGQLAADLPASQFRDLVERALFAADLIGYAKAAPRG